MSLKEKKSNIFANRNPNFFVYEILIIFLLISKLIVPSFLGIENISNILRQSAFLGIVAAGQTLVIITAGTDLSVSYLVTLGNVLSAQLLAGKDENIPVAFIGVALVGIIVGLINGMGIYFLKIPSLVMTLGMGSVLQGVVLIFTKGAPKGNASPAIRQLVSGNLLGPFPPVIFIWIMVSFIIIFLLKKTVFGRNVYSVGENPIASIRSGIPVGSTLVMVYIICGFLSAITGMLLVGYTGTSFLDAGTDYQMNSIAAVVMGGTLLSGGKGDYVGTIAGTIIICVLLSLLNIVNVPTYSRQIIRGIVILLILIVSGLQHKRR